MLAIFYLGKEVSFEFEDFEFEELAELEALEVLDTVKAQIKSFKILSNFKNEYDGKLLLDHLIHAWISSFIRNYL